MYYEDSQKKEFLIIYEIRRKIFRYLLIYFNNKSFKIK